MKALSKKNRDKAMRYIIDYYSANQKNHYIMPESLIISGTFKKGTDVNQIVSILKSMGLITLKDHNMIVLTDAGRCYFENQIDTESAIRKEHAHNWLIAVFSAIAGAFASEPLWKALHWLASLFHKP